MKTIGILGGMGPSATYDLANKITINTEASCDQDHIHILIDSNTQIPDRTQAIIEDNLNPLPELIKTAINLENAGADFLIIPCNTAHFFIEKMKPYLRITFLNMLEETAKFLKQKN